MEEKELIKRFAEVQEMEYTEAEQLIGAETDEEILKNISKFTVDKINSTQVPLNRAQRRALKKKQGKKNKGTLNPILDTAKKLDYIDLIQKLRELNEKQEKEIKENDDFNETN